MPASTPPIPRPRAPSSRGLPMRGGAGLWASRRNSVDAASRPSSRGASMTAAADHAPRLVPRHAAPDGDGGRPARAHPSPRRDPVRGAGESDRRGRPPFRQRSPRPLVARQHPDPRRDAATSHPRLVDVLDRRRTAGRRSGRKPVSAHRRSRRSRASIPRDRIDALGARRAHRGSRPVDHGTAPEDCRSSSMAAVSIPLDGIEADIRLVALSETRIALGAREAGRHRCGSASSLSRTCPQAIERDPGRGVARLNRARGCARCDASANFRGLVAGLRLGPVDIPAARPAAPRPASCRMRR